MLAKVAKIISDKQIVINVGSEQGVMEGDIFNIIDKGSEEVVDPDTGESLGTLDIIKCKVRVEIVYSKMSICIGTENSFLNPIRIMTYPSLKVNLNQITGGFSINNIHPVQIGDIAHKL